jgi:hypothetical protein
VQEMPADFPHSVWDVIWEGQWLGIQREQVRPCILAHLFQWQSEQWELRERTGKAVMIFVFNPTRSSSYDTDYWAFTHRQAEYMPRIHIYITYMDKRQGRARWTHFDRSNS